MKKFCVIILHGNEISFTLCPASAKNWIEHGTPIPGSDYETMPAALCDELLAMGATIDRFDVSVCAESPSIDRASGIPGLMFDSMLELLKHVDREGGELVSEFIAGVEGY